MEEKIKNVIDNEINPQLKMHAGSCELIDVTDGVVTVRLQGGCSGCPSSQITLLNGIAPILRQRVPEIKEVVLG